MNFKGWIVKFFIEILKSITILLKERFKIFISFYLDYVIIKWMELYWVEIRIFKWYSSSTFINVIMK
jgi:hypothetical protein